MAQYDVHANPDAAQRVRIPFVVVLQSDQLDHHSTRFVMPLVRLPRAPAKAPRRLAQTVVLNGEVLFLGAHQCAPLPKSLLKVPVASLRHDAAVLCDALDAVISGV